jgi:hypothetical protein
MGRQIRRVTRDGGDSVSRAGLARLSNDGGSHTAEETACLGEDAGGGVVKGPCPSRVGEEERGGSALTPR